jgi:hypothetical protein
MEEAGLPWKGHGCYPRFWTSHGRYGKGLSSGKEMVFIPLDQGEDGPENQLLTQKDKYSPASSP